MQQCTESQFENPQKIDVKIITDFLFTRITFASFTASLCFFDHKKEDKTMPEAIAVKN